MSTRPLIALGHDRVTVSPGTLVHFDKVGLFVNAGYREDPESYGGPMSAPGVGQPYVTINTEGLDPAWRYDERTGLLGSTTDVFTVESNDNVSMDAYVVTGPDGVIAAFNGHTPGFRNREMAENVANILNGEWPEQCGMPAISVDLNDAELYDDEGQGDTAAVRVTEDFYIVRPSDSEVDVTAFMREEDAERHMAALINSETTSSAFIETVRIQTPASAKALTDALIEEADPGDPNGLSVDKLVATLNRLGFPSAAEDAEEGVPANIIADRLREQGEHDAANELAAFGFDGEGK